MRSIDLPNSLNNNINKIHGSNPVTMQSTEKGWIAGKILSDIERTSGDLVHLSFHQVINKLSDYSVNCKLTVIL